MTSVTSYFNKSLVLRGMLIDVERHRVPDFRLPGGKIVVIVLTRAPITSGGRMVELVEGYTPRFDMFIKCDVEDGRSFVITHDSHPTLCDKCVEWTEGGGNVYIAELSREPDKDGATATRLPYLLHIVANVGIRGVKACLDEAGEYKEIASSPETDTNEASALEEAAPEESGPAT